MFAIYFFIRLIVIFIRLPIKFLRCFQGKTSKKKIDFRVQILAHRFLYH
jgi:predicted secreted protein